MFCHVSLSYLHVSSFTSIYCSLFFIAVTTNPRNTTAAVGTKVTLTCSASGVDDVMYQWMRKGKRVISSRVRGVSTNRLVINNIQPDDGGEYKCTASSGDVSVNSEYATLSVLGKLMVEGSMGHLLCVCYRSSSHHYTS